MRTVLVPKVSGVLSALGLAISDLRRDYVRPLLAACRDIDRGELEASFQELERVASADLDEPVFHRRADLRYRGQAFELTVDASELEGLETGFHVVHERRYGYRMEDEPVELVNLRVTATVPGEKPELVERPAERALQNTRRRANFDGEWIEVPVFDRGDMGAGSDVEGPAIVEFPEATSVVRPGWRGKVDAAGTLVVERT